MAAAVAPRSLVTAHIAALMQGAMHLGLVAGFVYLDLSDGWATTAAWLLVISSAFEALGGATNWLQGTGDQFAEKSLGYKFNSISGPVGIVGILIVLVGAIRVI